MIIKNKNNMNNDLDVLRTEEDALDQSVALNRIVLAMLENDKKKSFWIRIILIISILANIVIACIFIGYENQFTTVETTTSTVTTVEQDTGEGSGNNIYQAGSDAVYNQESVEEVNTDGPTESDYSYDYND